MLIIHTLYFLCTRFTGEAGAFHIPVQFSPNTILVYRVRMSGWMDRWMDEWKDEWVDGWTDDGNIVEWMDGLMDR